MSDYSESLTLAEMSIKAASYSANRKQWYDAKLALDATIFNLVEARSSIAALEEQEKCANQVRELLTDKL